ncbi:MAG: CHAP domain-containing protein [Proteobacteria bacterium]|nr:CHAP domain-containing protein [Pseudomonadota bacterium]
MNETTTPDSRQVAALPFPPSISSTPVRIVVPPTPLQCVPYARKVSRVSIRGDAWTWWQSAKGRYRRGGAPSVGSVLVLKRTRRLRLGHLAVVKAILNDREIVVDQANWLNRGRIHLNIPVRDVSAGNDWSAVRVWYAPGGNYGTRTYPVRGFIHPEPPRYTPTHPTRRG